MKVRLEEEMKIIQLHNNADEQVPMLKFDALLSELKTSNNQKRSTLTVLTQKTQNQNQMKKHQQEDRIIDLQLELDEATVINKGLLMKEETLVKSIQHINYETNKLHECIQILNNKNTEFLENKLQNQQQCQFIESRHHRFDKVITNEQLFNKHKLDKITTLTETKNKKMKDQLQEYYEQDQYLHDLENKLKQSNLEIQMIDEELSNKFHKIEQCAAFLQELDDFDKLVLIFIYENPDEFNLNEIYHVIKAQLVSPIMSYQLANSQQEYIDRARFSSVSARMKIFFKFHNNDLSKSVSQIIEVYRKLQMTDQTLKTRYYDLLNQKEAQEQILMQLKYSLDQYDHLEDIEEPFIDLDESNDQEAVTDLHIQIRHVEQNRYFFVRIYSTLTNAIFRIMNSLQNIKEVMKSCPTEKFDGDFYLRWTYNPLYTKMSQISQVLEKQYDIKLVAKQDSIRNSNKLLNMIYDHVEEKPQKRKSYIHKNKETNISQIMTLNERECLLIENLISSDIVLQQFLKTSDLKAMNLKGLSYAQVQYLIETEGYHVAHWNIRQSVRYLLQVIQETILDCLNMAECTSPVQALQKKYNFQQILNKNQNSIEYKTNQNWKNELIHKKIEQINKYYNQDDLNSEPPIVEDIKKLDSQSNQSQQKTDTSKKMTKLSEVSTSNGLRRYLNQISLKTNPNVNVDELNPIFTHLHHQKRRIEEHRKSTKLHHLKTLESIGKQSNDKSQQRILISPKIVYRKSNCKRHETISTLYSITPKTSKQNTRYGIESQKTEPSGMSLTHASSQFTQIYGNTNRSLQDLFSISVMAPKRSLF